MSDKRNEDASLGSKYRWNQGADSDSDSDSDYDSESDSDSDGAPLGTDHAKMENENIGKMNMARCSANKPLFFTGFLQYSATISMFWNQTVQYYEGQCLGWAVQVATCLNPGLHT